MIIRESRLLPQEYDADRRASSQYFDSQFKSRASRLLPAEYYATNRDIALVTVLGSCVAACLRDPVLMLGGMNHFMLPDCDPGVGESARYGSHAMELLINTMLKQGARRELIEAKVFGGGNVLQSFTTNQVGTRNAEFVLAYLAAERIPIRAKDLGGVHPRKVCFFPASGRAFVKWLPHTHDADVAVEEKNYVERWHKMPVTSSVELF